MRNRDAATSLPDRVAAAYGTLGVTGRIVLAVSGGADSLALFRTTGAIARQAGLTLCVAHLDHGLRSTSGEEAVQVAAIARSHGIEAFVDRIDVREVASQSRTGIEETARRVRYEFLARTASRFEAKFVATAHTADDLAETVLFHLLRGTGLRGLRGIPPRRRLNDAVTLVRPLLGATRVEIERYLASIGQSFLTDPSNSDPAFTRNVLRHEILPRLRETVNPRVDAALLRLSQQATEVSTLIVAQARRELRTALIESTPTTIRLRSRQLATCPRPVIRETAALAWRRGGWPRQGMTFAHWDALATIVIEGGRRTLPGPTDARRRRGELILHRMVE